MEKINAAITLAEELEDRIFSHDEFVAVIDEGEAMARRSQIMRMASNLIDACNEILPGLGINYAEIIPLRTDKVLRLLYAYRDVKQLSC